jgi:hypothetical protein
LGQWFGRRESFKIRALHVLGCFPHVCTVTVSSCLAWPCRCTACTLTAMCWPAEAVPAWPWLGYALAARAAAPVAGYCGPRCLAVAATLHATPLPLCPACAAGFALLLLTSLGYSRVSLSELLHCPLHVVPGDAMPPGSTSITSMATIVPLLAGRWLPRMPRNPFPCTRMLPYRTAPAQGPATNYAHVPPWLEQATWTHSLFPSLLCCRAS